MKPITLTLLTGLLAAVCALPAAATPLPTTAASLIAQASISPIYMEYGDIKGSVQALEIAGSDLNKALDKAVRGAATPPDPEAVALLTKVGQGDIILSSLLAKAAEGNTTRDENGLEILDCEKFGAAFMRLLSKKNPELTRFASIGWGLSEKKAAEKIVGLAKRATWEGSHDAIIAILIGLLRETEANAKAVFGDDAGGFIKAQESILEDARDFQVWQRNFGTGG